MTVTKPRIAIIVAALIPKLGIGNKGSLPWRLKKEMKYFREVTTRCTDPSKRNVVIMGRKTWDSIPTKFRPLPSRINVVLTTQDLKTGNPIADLKANTDGVFVANSIEDSIGQISRAIGLEKVETFYIIGGAQVYNHCVKVGLCDQILLTEITNTSSSDCEIDTYLDIPVYDEQQWSPADLSAYLKAKDITEFTPEEYTEGNFSYRFKLFDKTQ